MLWTIVKKEFIQQLSTRKLLFSLVTTFILSFFALHISATKYYSTFEVYSNAVMTQQKAAGDIKALDEDDYNSFDMSDMDYSVIRKPTPMSIYCRGMEDNFGSVGRLDPLRMPYTAQPFGQMGTMSGINFEDILKDTFSTIDFTFIVKFFFSLMVIIISFNIVSNEREQGTLKMIHAQNVSRRTLLNGKWLANSLLLGICIFLFILFSMLYVMLSKNIIFNTQDVIRLFLFFLFSFLFALLFFQASLLISCIFRSSQSVLITVFLIWLLSLFILPNIGLLISKRFVEIPPLDYVRTEQHKIYEQMQKEASTGERPRGQNLMYEIQDAVWGAKQHYLNRLKEQRAVYDLLSLISPSQVYSFASEHIMGTSIRDYDMYMNRVRLENENYTKQVKIMSATPPPPNFRALQFGVFLSVAEASAQNNRNPLGRSIYNAMPYFVWFIIINGILYFFTLLYYDRKTNIL
ncbi:ABC transporter permease [Candidatus Latescibacterota bacterium]